MLPSAELRVSPSLLVSRFSKMLNGDWALGDEISTPNPQTNFLSLL